METNILLSIIIPTRNRTKYMDGCLSFLKKTRREDYEVIIQDNSEKPDLVKTIVDSFNNDKIRYFYCGDKLSQTENSDLALSHARGEFVCYIGDDDTICESIFDLALAMKQFNVDTCTYSIPQYNWPDLIEEVPSLDCLSFEKHKKMIEERNPQSLLKKYLKNGVYIIKDLPRVYHGIVKKELLDQIKIICGSFFPGPSPDMANAVAVSLLSKKHYHINIPMIVSGFGRDSAGGMGKRKLHRGSLKNNFQLRDDVEKNWNPKIPKLWLQQTIYPESAYESLLKCKAYDYVKYLNYGAVYFECIKLDKEAKEAVKHINPSFRERIGLLLYFAKRLIKKVFSKKNKTIVYKEKMSITDALEIIDNYNTQFSIIKIFESVCGKSK